MTKLLSSQCRSSASVFQYYMSCSGGCTPPRACFLDFGRSLFLAADVQMRDAQLRTLRCHTGGRDWRCKRRIRSCVFFKLASFVSAIVKFRHILQPSLITSGANFFESGAILFHSAISHIFYDYTSKGATFDPGKRLKLPLETAHLTHPHHAQAIAWAVSPRCSGDDVLT
jgi:hypothetical protein